MSGVDEVSQKYRRLRRVGAGGCGRAGGVNGRFEWSAQMGGVNGRCEFALCRQVG